MTWIQTYSGKRFVLYDPKPDMVDVIDIAHSLAHIARFNGHTDRFYSVAEHCVVMAQQLDQEYQLAALLHDAGEAYVGDMARPLKQLIGAEFKRYEDRILVCIFDALGVSAARQPLSWPFATDVGATIKDADLRMMNTERIQLLSPIQHWPKEISMAKLYDVELECWEPLEARARYLDALALARAGKDVRKSAPTKRLKRYVEYCAKPLKSSC